MEKGDPNLDKLKASLTEIQLLQLEIHFIKERLSNHIDAIDQRLSERRSFWRDLFIAVIAAVIGAGASFLSSPASPPSASQERILVIPKPKDAKPTETPFIPQG